MTTDEQRTAAEYLHDLQDSDPGLTRNTATEALQDTFALTPDEAEEVWKENHDR